MMCDVQLMHTRTTVDEADVEQIDVMVRILVVGAALDIEPR